MIDPLSDRRIGILCRHDWLLRSTKAGVGVIAVIMTGCLDSSNTQFAGSSGSLPPAGVTAVFTSNPGCPAGWTDQGAVSLTLGTLNGLDGQGGAIWFAGAPAYSQNLVLCQNVGGAQLSSASTLIFVTECPEGWTDQGALSLSLGTLNGLDSQGGALQLTGAPAGPSLVACQNTDSFNWMRSVSVMLFSGSCPPEWTDQGLVSLTLGSLGGFDHQEEILQLTGAPGIAQTLVQCSGL